MVQEDEVEEEDVVRIIKLILMTDFILISFFDCFISFLLYNCYIIMSQKCSNVHILSARMRVTIFVYTQKDG